MPSAAVRTAAWGGLAALRYTDRRGGTKTTRLLACVEWCQGPRRPHVLSGRLSPLLITALTAITAVPPPAARAADPPPIRHVWVINEENGQVCKNSNPSNPSGLPTGCPISGFPPYLGSVLPAEGTLVQNY